MRTNSQLGIGKNDNLFLNVVALDTTIANSQNFGCLVELSFAGEPPRRFREEGEDDSSEADHRPLRDIGSESLDESNLKFNWLFNSPGYR